MENFPILDEEDSLCRARCFDTVRYHDNRLPVIVDRIKESQKFIRRSGIQRTGRFIGKDQLRLCDQSTCNGCSLLLSTGYFIWIFVQKLTDSQLLCDRRDPTLHFRVFLSRQDQRKENIILQGQCIQKVEILKDESKILPPECCHLFFPDLAEIIPF